MTLDVHPPKPEFLSLCAKGNVVPVYADLMADFETPVSAYAKMRAQGPAYLLESVEGGERLSRYSFIGCRPRKTFSCGPKETQITEAGKPAVTVPTPADPLALIEAEIASFKPVKLPGMPRFTGGAVGYISYEYATRIETTVPTARKDELGVPLIYFMLSDTLLIFDRAKQTIRLCVNAHVPPGRGEAVYDAAILELESLYKVLTQPSSLAPAPLVATPKVEVPKGNFTRSGFEAMVDGVKEYIRAGDIFQVVLAQRFEREFTKTPLDLYRALRIVNPSPYTFIMDTGEYALVGASPEVHVRLTEGLVEIRPLAGTRKRGATPEEDIALEQELLADEKERAEHLMLVDLARNDIGRVCTYGSIRVPEFAFIERYSHVMHIVSQVEGSIDPAKNAFDLMRATFPAGTVSGAPKVRAMQIIADKEGLERGFYAGALGYFGYDGNLDSCITLRTALVRDGKVYVQAGAGIVADSDPASEYTETINKAGALFKAVEIASRF